MSSRRRAITYTSLMAEGAGTLDPHWSRVRDASTLPACHLPVCAAGRRSGEVAGPSPRRRQDDLVTACGAEDPWAALGGRFVDGHYSSLRGRVRTHVIHEHLRAHLAPPPLRIVDVGGGAGHQSIPLARQGYDVTIVDPSAAMLERARDHIVAAHVDRRGQLVEAPGEDAPAALDGARFGAVLCHGVLMYLDDPEPLVDALRARRRQRGRVDRGQECRRDGDEARARG